MNRSLIVFVGWVGFAIGGNAAVAETMQIVRWIGYRVPNAIGKDIAWDGQHLWTLSMRTRTMPGQSFGVMHELDPGDGSLLSLVETMYTNYRGLTWDNTSLWTTSFDRWNLGGPADVALDWMERYSPDGTIISSFELSRSPDAEPAGAAFDGTYLWLSDSKHGQVSQVDPTDGTLISSFSYPGTEPRGLTWDGSSLWSVDGTDQVVYQMDTLGNVLATWSLPLADPYGITFDGEFFWILDNDSSGIYQLAIPEPSTLTLLGLMAGCLAAGRFVAVVRKPNNTSSLTAETAVPTPAHSPRRSRDEN